MTAAVTILEQAKAAGVALWGEGEPSAPVETRWQWKAFYQCTRPASPSCWRRLLNPPTLPPSLAKPAC